MFLISMLKPKQMSHKGLSKGYAPRLRHPTLVATMTFAILGAATTAFAQNNSAIGNLPLALICAKEGVTAIAYLSRVNADGSAIYMTPTDIFVGVSPEGVVDNRADGTCSGKTLAQLRESGQTRAFPE